MTEDPYPAQAQLAIRLAGQIQRQIDRDLDLDRDDVAALTEQLEALVEWLKDSGFTEWARRGQ